MKCFLVSILTLVTVASGFAQQTYAVVMGVADYVGTVNDLRYADDDAWLVTRFLRSPKGGSVPAGNIVTLVNGQASHANIIRALQLFQRAQRNDRVIVFFSGHGADGTFFTADGMELLHSEVKTAFRRSAAKTKVVWADACHSGSIRRKASARTVSQQTYKQLNDPSLNVVVMASSRSSQNSGEYDKLRQGAFTYYLVKGAEGAADTDRNRIVTISEHFRYVNTWVRQMTNNQQIPIIYGKFSDTTPVTIL
ncbi:caspase family protein [Larkinella terrae]|uniref:Caspase family protein n=1 Tax=Larkinella terrae TaxID=2025311 RepID=A0A7K0ENS5_9BACT|nr:caspase family protein [Larkinella terrae]MRS63490.1 caspase family protein [Larkinella terrae]